MSITRALFYHRKSDFFCDIFIKSAREAYRCDRKYVWRKQYVRIFTQSEYA